MICVETHFSFNRILLLAIGLWPYQRSRLVHLQIILILGIFTGFIVHQLVIFVAAEFTIDLIIKILSPTLFCITLMVQYNSFWINTKTVKYLLEQIQYMYNELNDENEIAIIKKYGNNSRIYTITLSVLCMLLICVLIILSSWSWIVGMISSMGKFPLRITLRFMKQQFIDKERYLYLSLFRGNAALYVGLIAMVATGTMLITYFQYACGMFKIASYRFEQAMAIDTLPENNLEKGNLIYKNLIYAIDMHRKAMDFSDLSVSRFKVMFFLLIITGIICVSLNIFQVFQTVTSEHGSDQFLLPTAFLIVHMLYVFIGNYIAQEIINHNDHIFITIYSARWYITPLYVQRMIVFLLQRGNKAFNLNLGGIFVGSMEGAATLVSTAISYFTVLYSMR